MTTVDRKRTNLYDYQREFVNDDSVFRIVNKARQLGFSVIIAGEAVIESLLFPSQVNLFVSSGEDAAKRVLQYCYDFIRSLPVKAKLQIQSTSEIKLSNNSQLVSLPANPKTIRGFRAHRVYIDEAAHFVNDREIFKAIEPSISRGGKLTVISTPNGRLNRFYEIYTNEGSQYNQFSRHEIPFTKCPDKLYQERVRDLRKNMNPIEFAQEYECFTEKADIFTSAGSKKIKDVLVGDLVLTAAGRFWPVTTLRSREYSGDLIVLGMHGNNKLIEVTPDHPLKTTKDGATFSWKKASDFEIGEKLVLPKIKFGETKLISRDLMVVMAWFISEGSASGNYINFSFNKNEIKESNSLISSLSKITKSKINSSASGTALVVSVGDSKLAEFLTYECGKGAINKKIPFHLINGYEKEFYEILIDGDGCRPSKNLDQFTTISKSLAYGIQLLANSIGMRASITFIKTPPKTVIDGRTVNQNQSLGVRIRRDNDNRLNKIRSHKNYISYPIKSIEKINFNGLVYNFSVKTDETYTVNGFAVHNCRFMEEELSLFSPAIVNQCVNKNLVTVEGLTSSNAVYMGIDFAKIQDETSINIVEHDSEKNKVILRHRKNLRKTPYDKQIQIIQEMDMRFHVDKINMDATGVGVRLFEEMEKLFGSKVEGVRFTPDAKHSLVNGLRLLFQNQRIEIPYDEEMISQLYAMERVQSRLSDTVKYKSAGSKMDDIVWSLSMACKDCFNLTGGVHYSLGENTISHDIQKRLDGMAASIGDSMFDEMYHNFF